MKNVLFALLVFLCLQSAWGQSVGDFNKSTRVYESDGSGKFLGLKVKLTIPTAWTQKEGQHPHIPVKFTYNFNDTTSISSNITIKKIPKEYTAEIRKGITSEKYMRDVAKDMGAFLSYRKVKIDGEDAAEMKLKIVKNTPAATVVAYAIYYHIVYKDYSIVLMYMNGSTEDAKSKQYF
ncbi:hypothetical protein [Paraflavitalea speifideaquila]|uniref:hypothetical protein n=1 Tax=Paraflavitalea speifideaquila TaxID=3076558 RepID=UPI0028E2380C|nr:hypothetical protein [Paraflavitalea speifideiaquila]